MPSPVGGGMKKRLTIKLKDGSEILAKKGKDGTLYPLAFSSFGDAQKVLDKLRKLDVQNKPYNERN